MNKLKLNSKAVDAIFNASNKSIEAIAKKALKDTANDVEKKMTEFIQIYFYDKYTPVLYERTYNLLKSVTQTKMVKFGNSYQITVYLKPSSDYTNNGHLRFYIDNLGFSRVPKNYNQAYDAMNVFDLASQGIHGLPEKGKGGWQNNRFKQTSPNFMDMINDAMFQTDLITKYSDMLKSNGFKVRIK